MTSAKTRFLIPHLFHDSTHLSPRYSPSFPNPRKRHYIMATSPSKEIPNQKRLRFTSQCISLVEHVTPETVVSCIKYRYRQPLRPFLGKQFEPEDPRSTCVKDKWIADSLTKLLDQTCAANISMQHAIGSLGPYRSDKYPDGSSSIFFSLKKPSIVLRSYILRLVRYMHVSKSVFVVALIYLDRLRQEDVLLGLTYLNVHRLLTTATALAAKYLEDESHRNSTIARIGGVPSTVEMNMLELQFLRRLGWNCAVSLVAYEAYERIAFGNQSCDIWDTSTGLWKAVSA